ncbi:MAG: vWA domain-containing protein [Cellulosilyticaceae bacterium]
MQKGLTELVFILDRSGSMGGLESDTIGGFNAMLTKQKKQEGDARVTTILFDDAYEVLHDRIPIAGVRQMDDSQYDVRGCTALLDAIGKTINKITNVQKHTSEELRAEKVIFVITTDGLENASKEYSYNKLKKMIEQQKEKYNWEFIFMGANMDAVAEAKKFGIDEDRAVTYQNDSRGIALNYEVLADTIQEIRMCESWVGSEWKKRIEKDEATRGRGKRR